MKLDGTSPRLLADRAAAPVWSPRENTLAYEARCGIRLMSLAASTASPNLTKRCVPVHGMPVWSPDGQKIAVNSTARGAARGIYVMNADGSGIRHLTRATGFTARGVSRIAWQPRQ
jgi:Tol biopolymer transport system component